MVTTTITYAASSSSSSDVTSIDRNNSNVGSSSGSSSMISSRISTMCNSKHSTYCSSTVNSGRQIPTSSCRSSSDRCCKQLRFATTRAPLLMHWTILFLVFSTLLATDAVAGADDRETFVPTKIAFCLTGQLARLELLSKLANIFIPNVRKGNTVHVYMLLDNSPIIKQTFWRYDYSETPYANYNVKKMEEVIAKKMGTVATDKKFKMRVKLEPVSQDQFEVVDGFVPVDTKVIDWQQTRDGKGINVEGTEDALPRFQNNMQWLAGLRDCTKWMQQVAQEQGFFYDLVVRLREDSYAFGEWILEGQKLKGAVTSAFLGSYRGINDHNLVLDRKYADPLFRGLIEDYYFKGSNKGLMWNNTEHRIYQLVTDYGIPIQTASLCQWPLIPLRALENSTHWMLHPAYTEKYYDACVDKLERESKCRCDQNYAWINFFKSGVTPINEPKLP